MRKRIISWMLVFSMLIAWVPANVFAAEEVASGTCGDAATWVLTDDGTLTISGTGAMTDWASAADVDWYSEIDQILSVIIEEGITSIGDYAFSTYSSLTSVVIPDGVTCIGRYAFNECTELTSVVIPDGVTTIEDHAFCRCSGLEELTVPETVDSIGEYAFEKCSALPSLSIPAGITTIETGAIDGCTSLTSFTIPDGVTTIEMYAFYGCTGLVEITIPDSVTSIDDMAFWNCNSLTDVYFGGTASEWGAITIGSSNECCTSATIHYGEEEIVAELASGTCGDNLTWVLTEDGTLTISGTGDMTQWDSYGSVPWYSYSGKITSVQIEDGVTCIGSSAFEYSGLTDVTISDSVTTIGSRAFWGCTGLSNVTIPAGVTSIESYAFAWCTGLTDVTISDSVTTIGSYTFWDCTGLTSVTIPAGVTTIESYTFWDCTGLTSVTIPPTVTSIVADAFCNCSALTDVYYEGTSLQWSKITIESYNSCLTDATIHYTGADTSVFLEDEDGALTKGLDGMDENAAIGQGLLELLRNDTYEYTVFKGETEGTEVEVTSSDTAVVDPVYQDGKLVLNAVAAGEAWISVVVDGVTGYYLVSVSNVVDSGTCGDNLTWVLTDDGTLTISGTGDMYDYYDDEMFDESSSAPWAEYNDDESEWYVTAVVIEDGVTSIGKGAFYSIDMTSGEIPDSVTTIGSYAFYGCTGLTSVTIPAGVTTIGSSAFYRCKGLTGVTIPAGVTAIGSAAFAGCSKLTEILVDPANTAYSSDDGVLFNINKTTLVQAPGALAGNYEIPAGVTTIGSSAFDGCTGLTGVTIPDSVTTIGSRAFYGCTGLTGVTIPDSVTTIGSYAFYRCKGLTDVTIPDSITTIESYAFCGCTGLTSVMIPASVTTIGSYTFWDCTGLTSVTIPDSVTTIGSYAFYRCTGLTSVTIPTAVTSIGTCAFLNCSALTDVYYEGTSLQWSTITIGSNNSCLTDATIHYTSADTSAFLEDEDGYLTKGLEGIDENAAIGQGLLELLRNGTYEYTVFKGETEGTEVEVTSSNTAVVDPVYQDGKLVLNAVAVGEAWISVVVDGVTGYYLASVSNIITSGTCGDNLTWEITVDGVLVIGGTGTVPAYDYMESPSPWMWYSDSFDSIVIGDGIVGMSNGSFGHLGTIETLYLPNSIAKVYYSAFESTQLQGIYYAGTKAEWSKVTFGWDELAPVTIQCSDGDIYFGFEQEEHTHNYIYVDSGDGTHGYYCDYCADGEWGIAHELENGKCVCGYADGEAEVTEVASGTCGDNLTWVLTSDGTMTISGTGSMGNYSYNGMPWYDYQESITALVIESGITSIGSYAFYGSNIKTAEIPEGVTSIGNYAFWSSRLQTVTLPDSLTSLGNGVFELCTALTSVNIPDGVTKIGDYTFNYCSSLSSITISDNVTSIGESAFSRCAKLVSITLPLNLKTIGEGAFFSCTSLITIVIPAGVTTIGDMAFLSCGSLANVFYGGSYEVWNSITIGTSNSKLTSATIHFGEGDPVAIGACGEDLTWKLMDDGILTVSGTGDMYDYDPYDGEADPIPWIDYLLDSTITTVKILDGVTSVGDHAFGHVSCIKQVSLPSTLESIGDEAFFGNMITEIDFPDTLVSIGESAFAMCSALCAVVIPDSVETVGSNAFVMCTSITDVTIGSGLTDLSASIFSACTSLTSLTINSEFESVGAYAFEGCKFTEISLPDSLLTIGEHAFSMCPISAIIIPDSVSSIGNSAFMGCQSLTYVTLPAELATIEEWTFCDCTSLKSIVIPASVSTVEYAAFSDCTSLTDVYLEGCTALAVKNADTGARCAFHGVTANIHYNVNDADCCTMAQEYELKHTSVCAGNCALTWSAETGDTENGAIVLSGPEIILPDGSTGKMEQNEIWECTVLYSENDAVVGEVSDYTYTNSDDSVVTVEKTEDNKLVVTAVGIGSSTLTVTYTSEAGKSYTATVNFSVTAAACTTHSYTGRITKSATCEETGVITYTCANCTSSYTEVLPVIVPDSNYVDADAEIIASGYCGTNDDYQLTDSAVWVLDSEGLLTIYGTGAIYRAEGACWRGEDVALLVKDVVVHEGITSVGGWGFFGCYNLETVVLPDSLTDIGAAFECCFALKSIVIPAGVTKITNGQVGAFAHCSSLTSVVFEGDVTEIGMQAFFGCDKLTSITIPDTVESIGDYALGYGLSESGEIVLMEDLVIYGYEGSAAQAYAEENNITFVELARTGVCGDNVSWTLKDGTLTISGSGAMDLSDREDIDDVPWLEYRESILALNIETGVTGIESAAFLDCINLESALLPETLREIGATAFGNCAALVSIELPESVTTIGQSAFIGCASLNEIVIPDGVESIGIGTFSGCSSLSGITIPGSVTSIGDYAFNGCTALTTIYGSYHGIYAETYAEANGYEFVSLWDCTSDGHRDNEGIEVPATCTTAGYITYTCLECGETYNRVSGETATGHNYEEETVAATCTSAGYTLHTCSACGDSYATNIVAATGQHNSVGAEIVTEAATCTTEGYTAYICVDCGVLVTTEKTVATGHSLVADYSQYQQPTCTESGYIVYVCEDCSQSVSIPLAALDHSYVDVITEPTCTQPGYTTHTCSVCQSSYADSETEAVGHSYEDTVITATCSAMGYTAHICSICSEGYNDTYTAMTEHEWDAGQVTTEATDTADGVMTYTCTQCGTTKTEPIAAKGHTYESQITTEATCTTAGVMTYTCTTCDEHSYTVEIPATGHAEAVIDDVAATCTTEGHTGGSYCLNCGTILEEATAIPVVDHTWDAGEITTEVTCTTAGAIKYTCTCCGTSTVEAILALGHVFTSYTTNEDGTLSATCDREGCGATDVKEATTATTGLSVKQTGETVSSTTVSGVYAQEETDVTINATNDELAANGTEVTLAGETTSSASAANSMTVETNEATVVFDNTALNTIAEADSDVTLLVTTEDLTATATYALTEQNGVAAKDTVGVTVELVDNDNNAILPEETSDTNGSVDITVPYIKATDGTVAVYYVNENGERSVVDSVYSETDSSVTFTTSHFSYYVICEGCANGTHVEAELHQYDASCTTAGYTELICTFCGETIDVIAGEEAGHKWDAGAVTTEATADKNGEKTYTCTVCHEEKTEVIPAEGHTFDAGEVTQEATCTMSGVMTYTCTTCEENGTTHSYTVEIEAAGHAWNVGTITTEATCTTEGVRTYSCEHCDETKTETVVAIGHDYAYSKAIEPTCCSAGYDIHVCQREGCNATAKYKTLSATGVHVFDNDRTESKTATCESSGYVKKYCAECEKSFTTVLESVGHVWNAGVLTAPTCTENGYTTHTCSVCGDSYSTAGEQATGHSYDDGKVTTEPTYTSTGIKTYTCAGCGAEETEELPERYLEEPPYVDVSLDGWYLNGVMWAVENNVTYGTGDNRFSPDMDCSRGQIITMLWRAAGEPDSNVENPFTDMEEGAYYYEAALWAYGEGITMGTGADTFSPDAVCTRAQIVTMLWRWSGSERPESTVGRFHDVGRSEYYYYAVQWALETGITTGVSDTKFAPDAVCTRAEAVTFLYRESAA